MTRRHESPFVARYYGSTIDVKNHFQIRHSPRSMYLSPAVLYVFLTSRDLGVVKNYAQPAHIPVHVNIINKITRKYKTHLTTQSRTNFQFHLYKHF